MTKGKGGRAGVRDRRRLEFDAIVARVRRDKAAFIAMLERNLVETPSGCQVWTGTKRASGYGRCSFMHDGYRFSIDVHRLFLILRLARPIRKGHEAAHDDAVCPHRHCVVHVSEQHWKVNKDASEARRAANRGIDEECPF